MDTWQRPGRNIILASGSPRRKELLARMGLIFDTITGAPIDEQAFVDAADLNGSLERLAIAKAADVAQRFPGAVVLSADTIVVSEGRVLGKPVDRSDARSMLEALSGRRHNVMTGVALTCTAASFIRSVVVSTDVVFRALCTDEIEWYLDSGEPFDKAGSYGIQGKAMIFVDKIEGCFYNVVGLPISGTIDLFKAFTARKEPRHVANE
jgi:septum formation protein